MLNFASFYASLLFRATTARCDLKSRASASFAPGLQGSSLKQIYHFAAAELLALRLKVAHATVTLAVRFSFVYLCVLAVAVSQCESTKDTTVRRGLRGIATPREQLNPVSSQGNAWFVSR
jgi:hypothetical protein